MSRALGQGAFGEVYQGILKNKTDSSETNVAVKTLPELSTNQGKYNIHNTIYGPFGLFLQLFKPLTLLFFMGKLQPIQPYFTLDNHFIRVMFFGYTFFFFDVRINLSPTVT